MVKLYVDGKLKDSRPVNVSTSGASVTLHWIAQAGEHDYTVKLYRLVGDQELWEDEWSGSLKVARDPDGLYAWLKVIPERINPGDGVVAFITIENTADYAQTWPVELVDNTGNVWWPKPDDYVLGTNYTLSKGVITIRPHKTAHIMVTDIEVYQNTTFYLKVSGITMAMAYVEVKPATVSKAFMECSNLKLSANKGDLTLNMKCNVYFTNPTGVQWNITRIDAEAHVLKTPHTKDLTIEPTKTIITHTIPLGELESLSSSSMTSCPRMGSSKRGWNWRTWRGLRFQCR